MPTCILIGLGMDATAAFDDVGHSSSAHEMLQDFYKGDLADCEQSDQQSVRHRGTQPHKDVVAQPIIHNSIPCCAAEGSCGPLNLDHIPVLVAVAMAGGALLYHLFYR